MAESSTATTFWSLLTDTARLLRQMSERTIASNGFGLTPGEIRTLTYVIRHEGSRQNMLAQYMGIEPMTLTAFLKRLEACHLIERRSDARDRRAKLIVPTAKAISIIAELDPTFDEVYRAATKGIGKEEMEEIAAVLHMIHANLTSDTKVGAPFSLLLGKESKFA